MKTSDIQQLEKRTPETLNNIYLIRDSVNSPWFKAYEFSAYLLEFYPSGLDENSRLKATHKKYGNSTMINVGLQIKSLKKYLPDIELTAENVKADEHNNFLILQVNLGNYDNINIDNYSTTLNEWKSAVDITQHKSNKDDNKPASSTVYSQPYTFASIMKNILTYRTDNKSLDELLEYIHTLKEYCANIIC